ncbi:hypothetical protein [Ulvibacter sp. MAR_2010_11]|uniref:hypothetical protein n=1 Tax=Ulvibacter sp. MAR_2010_11 TaxID=1250229 RepID=UPI0012FD9B56|nr:hypothetical protein [Ulvibacter sp. MAR_2010_11]
MVSCEDSTLPIDTLYNEVDTSQGIIRTLVFPANLVALTPGPSNRKTSIDMLLEVQEGDGSSNSFIEVRVFTALYQDQDLLLPTEDSQGNPIPEVLNRTLPASEWTPSEFNMLPSYLLEMSTQSIVDLFPDAQLTTPTFVATRLELVMGDGTVITNTGVGGSVATGAYHNAPFLYKTIFLPN